MRSTFNVSNLSLFDVDNDLSTNFFEERGNKGGKLSLGALRTYLDALNISIGPITRKMAKDMQGALQALTMELFEPSLAPYYANLVSIQ